MKGILAIVLLAGASSIGTGNVQAGEIRMQADGLEEGRSQEMRPFRRAPAPLRLLWFDLCKLPRPVKEAIRSELARIFDGREPELVPNAPSPEDAPERPAAIKVILLPRTPRQWQPILRLDDTVMGVVWMEEHGAAVFIFVPTVLRSAGLDRRARDVLMRRPASYNGREIHLAGRALGRVVAHELIHASTRSRTHAETGLMGERLSARALTAHGMPAGPLEPLAPTPETPDDVLFEPVRRPPP